MPQPRDYDGDERYGGGYAHAEVGTSTGPVLKWVAGIVGGFIVALMIFAVSCTSNKMDAVLNKQDDLSGDLQDLKGDVKVVTSKLESQEKQYERDRNETNRRLSDIERRP